MAVRALLLLMLLPALLCPAAPKKKRGPAVVEEADGDLTHLFLKDDPAAQAWLFRPAIDEEGEAKGDGKVDLVVALHGAGGNPRNFMLRRVMEKRRAWCLAVAGRTAGNYGGRSGFQWDGGNVEYIAEFVRYLVGKYPIRKQRVIVWGHSAGGSMTLATLAHAPKLFAGGLTTAAPRTPSGAHQEKRIAIYLGTKDPNWAAAATVRAYVEKLARKRRKGACAFFAVEGLGHAVPADEYLDLGFRWILHGSARGGEARVDQTPQGGEGPYRHILLRYRGAPGAEKSIRRSKAAAKKLAGKIKKALAKGRAFFPFEAACHSEDAKSASCGGGLGEDDLRAFLGKLPALKEGEVSAVLESPQGFHLVRRT